MNLHARCSTALKPGTLCPGFFFACRKRLTHESCSATFLGSPQKGTSHEEALNVVWPL
ncbi:hypothetical protein CPTSoftv3_028 [Klebsiella phage Soft]|uniref:Uncharacterized protein n=1 Tax=Klebsiella phage Soft TaxID=2601626 RepID=A0A5C1K847_9CAUD|nr:hypothetical protein HWC61_gp28 [Klebsiella phage Soft]QEM42146.1 hypothetical protein CPTSoftv3_028 [Klebsiella phage Soft]